MCDGLSALQGDPGKAGQSRSAQGPGKGEKEAEQGGGRAERGRTCEQAVPAVETGSSTFAGS